MEIRIPSGVAADSSTEMQIALDQAGNLDVWNVGPSLQNEGAAWKDSPLVRPDVAREQLAADAGGDVTAFARFNAGAADYEW